MFAVHGKFLKYRLIRSSFQSLISSFSSSLREKHELLDFFFLFRVQLLLSALALDNGNPCTPNSTHPSIGN